MIRITYVTVTYNAAGVLQRTLDRLSMELLLMTHCGWPKPI